ncbi:MAG TPA: hypothetical protein VE035_04230 [Puia sp.]|nr:hypothetical protein [Puia sp.]
MKTIKLKKDTIVVAHLTQEIQVNLDRSSWATQFKKAIKAGHKPEKSVWPDDPSEKAYADWTW